MIPILLAIFQVSTSSQLNIFLFPSGLIWVLILVGDINVTELLHRLITLVLLALILKANTSSCHLPSSSWQTQWSEELDKSIVAELAWGIWAASGASVPGNVRIFFLWLWMTSALPSWPSKHLFWIWQGQELPSSLFFGAILVKRTNTMVQTINYVLV